MFVWTSGMHPGLTLVFFVVGLVFMLYTFANAARWTGGGDGENDAPPRRSDYIGSRPDSWACDNDKCRVHNPAHARYCRMCGRKRS